MLLTNVIAAHHWRADLCARRFFDLSYDMLSTMDQTGRCVEVNEASKHLLGHTAPDLQGMRLLDPTHPDDYRRATARCDRSLQGVEVCRPRDRRSGQGRQLALAAFELGARA